MTTASRRKSLRGRIRTYALAGIVATTLAFPTVQVAWADAVTPTPTSTPDSVGGFSISVETVEQLTGLTAVVATDGQNVNFRAEPSNASESLAKIPDGTEVDLRVDMVDTQVDAAGTRWWPVSYDGQDGWISGEFLTQATTVEGDIVSSSLVAFDYTGTIDEHSTAKVFGNGQNVNVRAEPTATSEIVTKAADGQVISLRIDLVDTVTDSAGTRWWPVVANGEEGWISGFFLTDSNGATTTQPGDAVATAAPTSTTEATTAPATTEPTAEATSVDGTFAVGEFAQVFTGEGGTINVRETGSPDANVVDSLNDGEVVEIVSGPVVNASSSSVWYEVKNANATGFVSGDLLISSVEAPGTTEPTATEPPRSEEEEATIAATQTPAPTEAPTTPEPTTTPATQAPATQESDARFTHPLANYTRTQGFGCSSLGFYSYDAEWGCAVHNGLDLAAPSGTAIMASAGGTVVAAGWCNCGLGYYVEIDHGDGYHTLYGHMASQPYVSVGQEVAQGDTIGPVGSTGISTGPHVHFMIRINGEAVNPEDYL